MSSIHEPAAILVREGGQLRAERDLRPIIYYGLRCANRSAFPHIKMWVWDRLRRNCPPSRTRFMARDSWRLKHGGFQSLDFSMA